MSGLPWFKCYPRDFNDGMAGLTLEERGAYVTLLNLIYARGGPIPEDNWWLTSKLDCTTRAWTKIRAALVLKRKLYELDVDGQPHLMNERAAEEIAARAGISEKNSENGSKGGRNSGVKRNKTNDISKRPLQNDEAKPKPYKITDTELSVVPSDEETTGVKPPVDLNAEAWTAVEEVLTQQGGITAKAARTFFGKLLSAQGLEARDMLGPLAEAKSNRTRDPQAYLTRAAISRAKRRGGQPQKRVGFV